MTESQKKRNYFVSYVRGVALIFIIIIHLIDWSGITISQPALFLKDKIYVGVLFFISLVGTLVVIAYGNPDKFNINSKKLIYRALNLLGIYYLLSIIKYFVYDFGYEPFYRQFTGKHVWNILGILSFQSFTIPITILGIIAMFLAIGPIILFINKYFKHKNFIIISLILIFWGLSFLSVPSNFFTDFLYSRGFANFPFALWVIPYLIGVLVAMFGFEKRRYLFMAIFGLLSLIFGYYNYLNGNSLFISNYMYPIKMYYILVSFFAMFVLVEIFYWLEKIKNIMVEKFLRLISFLGDRSFILYVLHWIVIDVVYYFSNDYRLILYYVPVIIGLYIFYYSTYFNRLKTYLFR